MQEIEEKFRELSSALTKWIDCNGLALNIKKTNYMIFSRTNANKNHTFLPRINNIPIEQKQSARFLGVIIDSKLNWNQHIHAIKSKMARYLGIMYKLKGVLPQVARLTIFHSFIQSHLNYCSLIWGFSAKSNIEILFRAQKKGIRAIMPYHVNYFYQDGVAPSSTKSTFTEHNILTVQSIIIKNALIFMYKIHNFATQLPTSVRDTIPNNAPTAGSTHVTCADWLAEYNYCKYRNSIYFKGPLLFRDMSYEADTLNTCFTTTSLKNKIKSISRQLQKQGDATEWQPENFKLYNINGLRQSDRIQKFSS